MGGQFALIGAFFARLPKHKVMLTIDFAFLACHVFYLIFFLIHGITEMFIFNIVSVLVYAMLGWLINKRPENFRLYACIAMLEVSLHAGAATLFMGWDAGFSMFIICCAPFPFFLRFELWYAPPLLDVLFGAEFIALKIYTSRPGGVIYTHVGDSAVTRMFVFNTVMCFIMIVTFSSIHKFMQQNEEQMIRDKNEELSMLIKIDPLSKLFNRRAMVEFLKQLDRICRYRHETYVIGMGDLDFFKHVNDTYGHASGDMVITAVSKIMTETVPSEGYVCRWGGEELLFAIPNADSEKGRIIAEKIRHQLNRYIFRTEEGVEFSVTITLGITECNGMTSYERGVSIADQYLYYGKEQGRNRVVTKENFPPELLK